MISQSYIQSFIAKMQMQPVEPKQGDTASKTASAGFAGVFQDILDRTAADTRIRNAGRNRTSDSGTTCISGTKKDPENSPGFKSFREVVEKKTAESPGQKVETAEKIQESGLKTSGEKIDKAAENKSNVNANENPVILAVAQMLGIQPEKLAEMLEKAGISQDILKDVKSIESAVDKLAVLMDLDTNQKAALKELFETAYKAVEQVKPVESTVGDEETAADVPQKGKTVEAAAEQPTVKAPEEKTTEPAVQFKELMVVFKEKLDALKEKISQNRGKIPQEIVNRVQEVLTVTAEEAKPEQELLLRVDSGQVESKDKVEEDAVKPAEDSSKTQLTAQGGAEEEIKPQKLILEEEIVTSTEKAEPVTNSDDTTANMNPAVQQAVNNKLVNEAVKLASDVRAQKSDVIHQVIEKAKVVIDGQKSEMAMELKPDSLGKLALKVVTERGVVVAKFIAESDQVKAVLESNMQLLKDSLEKQGLAVNDINVSVGQHSYEGFRKNTQENENLFSRPVNTRVSGAGSAAVFGSRTAGPDVNPYSWSGSTINLTA